MLSLTVESKGLETCLVNADTLVKSRDGEIIRLRAALVVVEKEKEKTTTEKGRIQQKAFDDVYDTHEVSFNHCLRQVLLLCQVSDPSVFDINKDIYHGELMPIDDIANDGTPMLERSMLKVPRSMIRIMETLGIKRTRVLRFLCTIFM